MKTFLGIDSVKKECTAAYNANDKFLQMVMATSITYRAKLFWSLSSLQSLPQSTSENAFPDIEHWENKMTEKQRRQFFEKTMEKFVDSFLRIDVSHLQDFDDTVPVAPARYTSIV